jgi:hypothetical protein
LKAAWVLVLLCLLIVTSCHRGYTFSPPSGPLVAGFRETATHRAELPVFPLSRHEGMPETIDLWLHVTPQGGVIDVKTVDSMLMPTEVRNTALRLRYKPFTRDGVPTEAWVQDTLSITAVEKRPLLTMPFPQISDPKEISIQLSRSGCYGSCPSYSVTIRGDGAVTFQGSRFVSIPGTHTAQIPESEVSTLLNRFRSANFLALSNVYRAGVTDNPTYCLKLKLGGEAKVVEDYVGAWVGMPATVTELEDAVDQAADSARWVSSSPGTLAAMLEAGIALGSADSTQILRKSVLAGDLVTARSLLSAGTPVSPTANTSNKGAKAYFAEYPAATLPELAVESRNDRNRVEMLKTVLNSPAVRADQAGKQRALARAVEAGHLDLALTLIKEGADPRARFTGEYTDREQNESYLSLAAASGVWGMIDDALSRPHDINAVDSNGRTALVNLVYNAPQKEDIFPLVDRLLAAGAGHSDLDRILVDICQANWIPGLVARGGNVNARDSKGNTPLFQSCSLEGVQAMLDAGADPTLRNSEGKTAIEATYPPENGKEDSRALLIRRYIAEHPRLRTN